MQTEEVIYYIKQYDNYIDKAIKIIDESPFKLDFFLKLLEIKKTTFYSKKKNKTFTNQEILKMLEAIEKVQRN